MSSTLFVSLLVAIVGMLIYVLASNPKLAECGRLATLRTTYRTAAACLWVVR